MLEHQTAFPFCAILSLKWTDSQTSEPRQDKVRNHIFYSGHSMITWTPTDGKGISIKFILVYPILTLICHCKMLLAVALGIE